jgi:uncharacterized protein (TIGR02246 family)
MSSRNLVLAALFTSAAVAACAPAAPPPPDTAAVKTAIEAINAKIVADAEKGDSAAVAATYDADATVMPPGEPAWHGSAAIAKGWGGMLGAFAIRDFTLTSGDVVVGGDYAAETGTYKMTMVPKKGAPMNDNGKYLVVWKKQADGSWKPYRDIWNTDVTPKQ